MRESSNTPTSNLPDDSERRLKESAKILARGAIRAAAADATTGKSNQRLDKTLALEQLQEELLICASNSRLDCGSPCHNIAQWVSHGGHIPQLLAPLDQSPVEPMDVVVVGVNPHWSGNSNCVEQPKLSRWDSGSLYWGYHRQLLSKLPTGVRAGGMELVQCGSPDGCEAHPIIGICRRRFFDKAIEIIRPKVLIATGRFVGESLYPLTLAYAKGKRWQGMWKQHATVEVAIFGEHECSIAFVAQPSARGSKEKREAATDAVARAYFERTS